MMDLEKISPFASFLFSFSEVSLPVWLMVLVGVVVYWMFFLIPVLAGFSYLDRKMAADIQMRIGPNRVGPFGIFQAIADSLKYFLKEEISAFSQENIIYRLGPIFSMVVVFVAIGDIPLARDWVLSSLSSGVVFILSALALSHLLLFWAAYSAQSAWSVVSSFRILSLITTYLVPMAFALVPPILITGSTNLRVILDHQKGLPSHWIVFHNPATLFSFLTLFFSMHIWQARDPMDFSTAQEEIAGGFRTEFSGIGKGYLQLHHYMCFFLSCAFVVTLFLGGGSVPFNIDSFGRAANVVEALFFLAKTFLLAFFSIWLRWSLPRFRIDQIVSLSWRVLVPSGLIGALGTALWLVLFNGKSLGELL